MIGALIEWLLQVATQARPWALVALDLVIALAVTVHVLLTKREVGAAIGWIGLGWISPTIGGPLYFVLGINRVQRRATRIRVRRNYSALAARQPPGTDRDDHLAPLESAVRRLTGRPALGGNTVALLQNGDEAYPRMLQAIEAAERSVALSTYILRDDEAGGPIIDALIAARKRGCEVRVLIDGIGSGWFHSPRVQPAARRRRAGRALHAFDVAVAHALPQLAHAQEGAGGRWQARLRRRHEYRAREHARARSAPPRAGFAFRLRGAGGHAADGRLRARLGVRDRREPGRRGLVPAARRSPARRRRASSLRAPTRTSRRSSS